MDESRVSQGMKWNEVAERGNISVPTLRRIRHEHDYPLTGEAGRAIERGLGWLAGDVDRVLAGGTYTERSETGALDPRRSSVEEYVAALIALETQHPAKYERVLARIDVVSNRGRAPR